MPRGPASTARAAVKRTVMGPWNKWRVPFHGEEAVYAAKARQRPLDGEHGVLGFPANGNHVWGRPLCSVSAAMAEPEAPLLPPGIDLPLLRADRQL